MRTLLLETSTERGLLAFWEDDQILTTTELPFGFNQSKFLMPELEKIVLEQVLNVYLPDCLAVGVGPGSYTGIRIGGAVAKALTYAWKVPLVSFSSLEAFVPRDKEGLFCVLIDAKIGGVYIIKGKKEGNQIHYFSSPEVCPLAELQVRLKGIERIVTPSSKILKGKMDLLFPHNSWQWEESYPSVDHLKILVKNKFYRQDWSLDGHLDLLYLHKTQAEKEKEKEKNKI